jgi:hypothetical protein
MNAYLKYDDWNKRAAEHKQTVEGLTSAWLNSHKDGKSHPVIDFLFKYFSFPYKRLIDWTPGLDVDLETPFNDNLSDHRFEVLSDKITLREKLFPYHRLKAVQWTLSLLRKTIENKSCFNCYGLHEWAMVYQTDDIRHKSYPFRLSDDEIKMIVEDKPLQCTHYDALRFYTEAALPLNRHSPTRNTQEDFEQSACLHANMDLYKWAYKMYPWISSELLLEAFELAMDCRRVDMKASPYDLLHLGYEPIKIETLEGREEYVREQNRLQKKSVPVRQALIACYEEIEQKIGQ